MVWWWWWLVVMWHLYSSAFSLAATLNTYHCICSVFIYVLVLVDAVCFLCQQRRRRRRRWRDCVLACECRNRQPAQHGREDQTAPKYTSTRCCRARRRDAPQIREMAHLLPTEFHSYICLLYCTVLYMVLNVYSKIYVGFFFLFIIARQHKFKQYK